METVLSRLFWIASWQKYMFGFPCVLLVGVWDADRKIYNCCSKVS